MDNYYLRFRKTTITGKCSFEWCIHGGEREAYYIELNKSGAKRSPNCAICKACFDKISPGAFESFVFTFMSEKIRVGLK